MKTQNLVVWAFIRRTQDNSFAVLQVTELIRKPQHACKDYPWSYISQLYSRLGLPQSIPQLARFASK